ncbi:hypothetical protein JW872_02375 [Candidatus Babeliales bacterium]|nr:hypothetical protein [Candidatus Babeliales bacterium]
MTIHKNDYVFSGNLFIFHAFDFGDEINLDSIKESQRVQLLPLSQPKYFKNYHAPLSIELPHPHNARSRCVSSKLHHFGVLSLTYQIPFNDTLDNIRKKLITIYNDSQKQSHSDAVLVYKKIKDFIKQPHFFHLRSSYFVIQVDPNPEVSATELKNKYGGIIASALRFETESLSEFQKEEILADATGYYRGDLIIIDTEAAFTYDAEYYEILDLFEFSNLHKLELQYFDRVLDRQLYNVYEQEATKPPFKAYLPFVGSTHPIGDLGRLKVDISVITERLESSIKLVGEPYFTEIYSLLVDKLDLKSWKDSIDKKLAIIKDVRTVYFNRIDGAREDLLSLLIALLIFIEITLAIYLR